MMGVYSVGTLASVWDDASVATKAGSSDHTSAVERVGVMAVRWDEKWVAWTAVPTVGLSAGALVDSEAGVLVGPRAGKTVAH